MDPKPFLFPLFPAIKAMFCHGISKSYMQSILICVKSDLVLFHVILKSNLA